MHITDEEWNMLFETNNEDHIAPELRGIRKQSKLGQFLVGDEELAWALARPFAGSEVRAEIKRLKKTKHRARMPLRQRRTKFLNPSSVKNIARCSITNV